MHMQAASEVRRTALEGRMARKVKQPSEDPLMQGPRKAVAFSLPEPLAEALRELSMRDGVRSTSEYVSHMLLAAVRQRLAVLDAEADSTHTGQKKPKREK
jgi:hypothetical protein